MTTISRPRRKLGDRLGDLPWIVWLILVTLLAFWVWNPVTASVFTIITSDTIELPIKALIVGFTGVLLWLIYTTTIAAIGMSGVVIILGLVGLIIWAMNSQGWFDITNVGIWQWLVQPIIGLIGATGICWPKLSFAITGKRSTIEAAFAPPDHDHDD